MQAPNSLTEDEHADQEARVEDPRERLLGRLPVDERRLELAGIETAVLEGGDGPPILLLHGPGESSSEWMRVLPELAKRHRVIVPDLPGHGASALPGDDLDEARVLAWLDAAIDETCVERPVLVGRVVGGSIAARYAAGHSDRIHRLVLVDTLGLRWFLPSPGFAFRLFRFMSKPTAERFGKFLDSCMRDADGVRADVGGQWDPFKAYYVGCARTEETQEAMGALMKAVGVPGIASDRLEAIDVPTALIWGRHDKATPVKVAQRASRRYGWPLRVIEESGADPEFERPRAFLEALDRAIEVAGA